MSLAASLRKGLTPRPEWLPGLAISALIAGAATTLTRLPLLAEQAISPLIIAILLGIAAGNGLARPFANLPEAGFALARGPLLRLAIVIYGFRITLAEMQAVGLEAVAVSGFMVLSTLLLAYHIGRRWFGLDRDSALLIGVGSSICGAAAVLGAEGVLRSRSAAVGIAVATVVVFGTMAMFLYPMLLPLLDSALALEWNATARGIYVGSTIHEVAQVLVAGSGLGGGEVARAALVTKMMRVCMLAPVLIVLAILCRRDEAHGDPSASAGIRIPWFAIAFLLLIVIHPYFGLSAATLDRIAAIDDWLLATAMVALGMSVRIQAIRAAGKRPLLLGALLFVYLVIGGLAVNLSAANA